MNTMSQLDDSERRNEITMNRWRLSFEDMTDDELSEYYPCVCADLKMTHNDWRGLDRDKKIKIILEALYPEDDKA